MGKTKSLNRPLLTLEKDDVFGHLPFSDHGQEPQYASVIESENLKFNKLNNESILEEYDKLPTVFQDMISNLCTCIAKTTNDCLVYEEEAPVSEAAN